MFSSGDWGPLNTSWAQTPSHKGVASGERHPIQGIFGSF